MIQLLNRNRINQILPFALSWSSGALGTFCLALGLMEAAIWFYDYERNKAMQLAQLEIKRRADNALNEN